MDYRDMLRTHQQSRGAGDHRGDSRDPGGGAGASASCGLTRRAGSCGFLEKPQTDEEIDMVRLDPAWIDRHGIASGGRDCLASMGIYIFNRDFLLEVLDEDRLPGFRQGGLSGRVSQPPRAGAPV